MITRESVRGIYPVEPLAQVVEFLDHKRRAVKQSERVEGPYGYFGANGQQGTIDDYIFNEPLVLVAEDGGHFDNPKRGIAYQIQGKTWVNNHAHVLRPTAKVDIRFLTRVLENYDVRPFISGTTRAKLTKGQASKIEIPLPPLEEQKRIAAILDQADALRRLRARALARLDALGQAIFHEMFGAFPKTAPLGDLAIKITDGTHQAPEWADDGVPFIFVSNVRGQRLNLETHRFVTPEEHKRLIIRTGISEGDVLYTCVGSYGNAAVVSEDTNFVFQRHIAHIKPNPAMLDSQFLSFGLEAPTIRAQADKTATGIAQKTVTLKALKNFQFPCPDIEAQRAFRVQVAHILKIRTSVDYALKEQEFLFASLQHRAFQGELLAAERLAPPVTDLTS
jgi:type I restriction enzyme S subunit